MPSVFHALNEYYGIDWTGEVSTLCIAMEQVRAEDIVYVFHDIKQLHTQRRHMVLTAVSFCYG